MTMTRSFAIALCLCAPGALAASMAHAVDVAKYVTAEEITGVVVEAGTGKPIANAVVAIRFERNNTGHSGPHCFRSMAVEADAQGHFRFAPWTQENTQANATYGDIKAYKAGYAVPWHGVEVHQSRRTFLGIAFSDTIHIPRQEVRVELKPFVGSEQDRMDELHRAASQFTCTWKAYNENLIFLERVRDEYAKMPLANVIRPGNSKSRLKGFEEFIEDVRNPSEITRIRR
jgi:hypothetical protein